jgi:ribosomal protein L37AE/L43A
LIKEEDKFVERSHNKFIQMAKDFSKVCPECKSKNILVRRRKTPRYVCQNCGNEFHNPKTRIVYTSQKQKDDFGRHYSNPDE